MNLKPGSSISVKPIVFIPKNELPSGIWKERWQAYHEAAQQKFNILLKGRDTFTLDSISSHQGQLTTKEYRQQCFTFDGLKHPRELEENEGCSRGVETMLAELLLGHGQIKQYNRYTLPHVLSILLLDTKRNWVGGGGRCLNGDLNLGGGVLVIPSWQFEDDKLMSTLLHELGHSFGLPHCNQRPVKDRWLKTCYYGGKTSQSIMSYNEDNWTNSLDLAKIPGQLLGDDMYDLSQNKWVFPRLNFDSNTDFDMPPALAKCKAHPKTTHDLHFGPMHLFFCTSAFSMGDSHPLTLNDHPSRWILSSDKQIGYQPEYMWHSKEVQPGAWVSMDVTFPKQLKMNRVLIYTAYGEETHRPDMLQIEWKKNGGKFEFIKRVSHSTVDQELVFPTQESNQWRLAFRAGSSGHVVIRGFRFFIDDEEIFPPIGPHATTSFGAMQGSRVSNLVEIQRVIKANGPPSSFDRRSMWMSDKSNEQGWVSIEIIFPTQVKLDKLLFYFFHFNQANLIQLEVADATGAYDFVKRISNQSANSQMIFPARMGKAWKISFHNAASKFILIRGLRFLIGNAEYYPPAQGNLY